MAKSHSTASSQPPGQALAASGGCITQAGASQLGNSHQELLGEAS